MREELCPELLCRVKDKELSSLLSSIPGFIAATFLSRRQKCMAHSLASTHHTLAKECFLNQTTFYFIVTFDTYIILQLEGITFHLPPKHSTEEDSNFMKQEVS